MSKTVDGKTTKHIWDGTNIVGDVTDGTVTKYIRGLQLISSKNGSNENFYTYNGHGDVVQLTNSTGAITKQYDYDAFGVETNKTDNDTNPFRYCGEYYDSETDSIYLRARYYRPTAGRFITEDPINDGLNWYVYCSDNPINALDPSGEYTIGVSMPGYIIEARNVAEYGSGVYCDLRGLADLSGAGITWVSYGNTAVSEIYFNKNDSRYKIRLTFNEMWDGKYADSVQVYKNDVEVDNNDPVKSQLQEQTAYFFLKKSENGEGLRIQAKMYTMLDLFGNKSVRDWFTASYEIALMGEKYYSLGKQEVLDYLRNQPLFSIDLSGKMPTYDDILAKILLKRK